MTDDNDEMVVTPESAGAYIKRGLEHDFTELANASKDLNFRIAHICMLNLASHYILCDEKERMNPREAYEKAIKYKSNYDETMIKTLVTQFSLFGEEFGSWVENPNNWETLWAIERNE